MTRNTNRTSWTITLALAGLVAIALPASAIGEIVTEVTSTVDVDNSKASEASETAECTVEGDGSACNDSCHGENACSGGNGGNGGEACEGGTNVVVVGDGNCEGGNGGNGGESDGRDDGEDGDDG